jgi:hypothetical protein
MDLPYEVDIYDDHIIDGKINPDIYEDWPLDMFRNSIIRIERVNNITSLEGLPPTIGALRLRGLPNLESLEGCPTCKDQIYIAKCDKLTTWEGFPRVINTLIIEHCPGLTTFKDINVHIKLMETLRILSNKGEIKDITSILKMDQPPYQIAMQYLSHAANDVLGKALRDIRLNNTSRDLAVLDLLCEWPDNAYDLLGEWE